MNTANRIRELVQVNLSVNPKVDVVRFMDQLLLVASEVGEIRCTLANEGELRFQLPNQPAWQVELERARAKLRMLCARLGVLCHESGDLEVSLYGGEGVIKKGAPDNSGSQDKAAPSVASVTRDGQSSAIVQLPPEDLCRGRTETWTVRFKNTMHEHEFTLSKCIE